ncbi:MAG: hypothetical protein KatS3mg053_3875 [Candidatus Roseilinea sp.]|nr:MAG: hypothetical protein KatS3mg053_3875 [Candidatus Roseilinea sp.]
MSRPLGVFLVALITALAGCANERHLRCDDLRELRTLDLLEDSVEPDEALKWLMKGQGANWGHRNRTDYIDGAVAYSWEYTWGRYTIYLGKQGKRFISLQPNANVKFTISDAVRCFGQPTHYQAYYQLKADVYIFEFNLWYPATGTVVVHRFTSNELEDVSLSGHFKVNEIVYVRPGGFEMMMRSFKALEWFGDDGQKALSVLKPWPGDFGSLKVNVVR